MTGKSKNQSVKSSQYRRHEQEIERLRDENKWNKLKDYVHAISAKDAKSEHLIKFCLAEVELENYLFLNPLVLSMSSSSSEAAANASASKDSAFSTSLAKSQAKILYDTETMLKDLVAKADYNASKPAICTEAAILLAKLFYSQMRYDEAYKQLSSGKLALVFNEQIVKLQHSRAQSQNSSISCVQQNWVILV